MEDWNIQSRATKCVVTGREFVEGEIFYSLLFRTKSGYERQDLCTEAYANRNDNIAPISNWHSKFEKPSAAPVETLKKDDAEGLLRQLLEKNEEGNTNSRYILAAMLERKKILKPLNSFRNEAGIKITVYEHSKTGESFTIVDPELNLEQMDPVQREVVSMLGGRVPGSKSSPPALITPQIENPSVELESTSDVQEDPQGSADKTVE